MSAPRAYLLLVPVAALAVKALLPPSQCLEDALTFGLGWADERWYAFYQGALCRLGEDPGMADRMYPDHPPHRPWPDEAAAFQRLLAESGEGCRDDGGEDVPPPGPDSS